MELIHRQASQKPRNHAAERRFVISCARGNGSVQLPCRHRHVAPRPCLIATGRAWCRRIGGTSGVRIRGVRCLQLAVTVVTGVTVCEIFSHRPRPREIFRPRHGGAKLTPPCDLGFRIVRGGRESPPPENSRFLALSGGSRGCRFGTTVTCPAARPAPTAHPVDKSAYSTSIVQRILDVVVGRSYLSSMTTTAPTTTTTTEPQPPSDAPESFGARLARRSREAQGLGPGVSDPTVLAELRELCAAPRPTRGTAVTAGEGPAS